MKLNGHLKKDILRKTICIGLLLAAGQSIAGPGDLGFRFVRRNIGIRDLTTNYGVVYAAAGAEYANGNYSFEDKEYDVLDGSINADNFVKAVKEKSVK